MPNYILSEVCSYKTPTGIVYEATSFKTLYMTINIIKISHARVTWYLSHVHSKRLPRAASPLPAQVGWEDAALPELTLSQEACLKTRTPSLRAAQFAATTLDPVYTAGVHVAKHPRECSSRVGLC